MGGRGSWMPALRMGFQTSNWMDSYRLREFFTEYDGEGKVQAMADLMGFDRQTAFEYAYSLFDWSAGAYLGVRAYQQGKGHVSAASKEIEARVEDFLAKAPKWKGGEVSRGIAMEEEDFIKLVKGAETNMRGTASWTTNPFTAQDFAKYGEYPVIFKCKTQSRGVDIQQFSTYPGEREVLVGKDSRYKVKGKPKQKGGFWYCEVVEI